jgi:acetyltransferase-like isoleucine patch superfamily enzyme
MIPDRLHWLLWRRWIARMRTPGFHANRQTYACARSRFAEHVILKTGARIVNSQIGRWGRIHAAVSNCDVGGFCSFGEEALVGGLGRHPMDQVSSHSAFNLGPKLTAPQKSLGHECRFHAPVVRTRIGNDVWIARRAIVLNGAHLGDGVVVAAGAVVTKPMPAYAFVAGVPARVVRFRFEEPLREALLASTWWTWPEAKLAVIAQHFSADTPLTLERWQIILKQAEACQA